MSPSLEFSRTLAVGIGVATPFLETVRRWREVVDGTVWWPAFVDDYLIGAFLLVGAMRVRREGEAGRATLAAAWAFLCGMAYGSVFGQLQVLSNPDPSGLSPTVVVAVKAVGLLIGIAGLVTALRTPNKPA
jgi:hypothetical protein